MFVLVIFLAAFGGRAAPAAARLRSHHLTRHGPHCLHDLRRPPGGRERGRPGRGLLWPLPGATADAIVPRAARRLEHPAARRARGRRREPRRRARAPARRRDPRARVRDRLRASRWPARSTTPAGAGSAGRSRSTLNVGSRVQAARRRRGRTLLGHVRYPWLCGVYARRGARVAGTGAAAARRRGRRRQAVSRPRASRAAPARRSSPPTSSGARRGFASTTRRTRPPPSTPSSPRWPASRRCAGRGDERLVGRDLPLVAAADARAARGWAPTRGMRPPCRRPGRPVNRGGDHHHHPARQAAAARGAGPRRAPKTTSPWCCAAPSRTTSTSRCGPSAIRRSRRAAEL